LKEQKGLQQAFCSRCNVSVAFYKATANMEAKQGANHA
jgi:hypothetical protein